MSKTRSVLTRWLGVGLAVGVCIVTLGLTVTGRIGMYINPDGAWFAVGMSVVGVVAAAGTFLLPLGAEADHGHDHGDAPVAGVADAAGPVPPADLTTLSRRELRELRETQALADLRSLRDDAAGPASDAAGPASAAAGPASAADHHHDSAPRRFWPALAAATGGVLASGVVLLMLALPPASLSAQAAADRDIGSPPLFGGDDVVVLAASGDVGTFGIGEWATVFATAADPSTFDGVEVSLTGFLTAGGDGEARLSRLVVTHCVIDAQPASVTLAEAADDADVGQWLQVDGVVSVEDDGSLVVTPTTVTAIAEPTDPYEY